MFHYFTLSVVNLTINYIWKGHPGKKKCGDLNFKCSSKYNANLYKHRILKVYLKLNIVTNIVKKQKKNLFFVPQKKRKKEKKAHRFGMTLRMGLIIITKCSS